MAASLVVLGCGSHATQAPADGDNGRASGDSGADSVAEGGSGESSAGNDGGRGGTSGSGSTGTDSSGTGGTAGSGETGTGGTAGSGETGTGGTAGSGETGTGGTAGSGETGTGGTAGGGETGGGLSDSFDGTGPLSGYTTYNASALPDVSQRDGRYRAHVVNNSHNETMHFNQDQGRLDAKLVSFPFDVVARNIGIGRPGDSQTAPPTSGVPLLFAGLQVHVTDLESRNWSFVVVGHKGDYAPHTVEGKNTVNGVSAVSETGPYSVPNGRADLRIVGNADRTLTVYWQVPNPQPGQRADDWVPYRGTGKLPGRAPSFGQEVYVGLITYASYNSGLPFVGTCDAIQFR